MNNININRLDEITGGLIFDRTQSDADYASQCVKNGVYLFQDLKGAYNISDRNRTAAAVNLLSECLVSAGYSEARVKIRDGWEREDIPSRKDHEALLSAIKFLSYFLPYSQATEIPGSLDLITYQKANAVERVLFDLCGVFSRLFDSWPYCGDGFITDFDPWDFYE